MCGLFSAEVPFKVGIRNPLGFRIFEACHWSSHKRISTVVWLITKHPFTRCQFGKVALLLSLAMQDPSHFPLLFFLVEKVSKAFAATTPSFLKMGLRRYPMKEVDASGWVLTLCCWLPIFNYLNSRSLLQNGGKNQKVGKRMFPGILGSTSTHLSTFL